MLLKKEPAYRKAEKEDFPLIREFIRRNYKDRWEFEEAHTEKRLTRLLFYTYMISRDSITVATYRDQVVGVLITGKGSKVRFAPVFRLKKGYHFLRLKLTREGRKNLEHFNKLQDMKKQLTISSENSASPNILFLYVSKDYRRNGIGTGLLKQISAEKKYRLFYIYGPAGSQSVYGKPWFHKEKRGFPDAGAEQKTLPGKRSSLSEENPLRNAFMNYTGENMI